VSKEEVERFVADIKTQPDLIDELKGTSGGIDSIVDFANAKGYKISADEARTYIQDKVGRDLTDVQRQPQRRLVRRRRWLPPPRCSIWRSPLLF
jgi:hypothetical protein